MKVQDSLVLFSSGLAVWLIGTIYYAYSGTAVLDSSTVRYWISFFVLPVVTAAICIAVLRWLEFPPSAWASGMLLLAIPGMIGEAVVLSHFSTFMPRLQETSAGRYGALLFATYACVLGIAEVVTHGQHTELDPHELWAAEMLSNVAGSCSNGTATSLIRSDDPCDRQTHARVRIKHRSQG